MPKQPGTVRVAAVADIHLGRMSHTPPLPALLGQVAEQADVFALCGDLTDRGEPDEARQLARLLASTPVPIVAVLGNHDYEAGKVAEVKAILCEAGVHVLDGEAFEIHGIGFAGVKGFCGGFGRRALGPWGEPVIKSFVNEALQEALKLETALGQLRADRRVVLLHYSPIAATVEGEPMEIYPYLGSSRLEEPLTRYPVDAVFHGHAHHGTLAGRTKGDAPVYNVSLSLLQRAYPDGPLFKVVELKAEGDGTRPTQPEAAPLRRASDRPVA
ncbi:MAG TPA: metallophosphoesterase [Gemmatimonadales bacterium]|jgi:Icc-related predicted phosphoesterase